MEPIVINFKRAQKSLLNIEAIIEPQQFSPDFILNKETNQVKDLFLANILPHEEKKSHEEDEYDATAPDIYFNEEADEAVVVLNCITFLDTDGKHVDISSLLSEVREETQENLYMPISQSALKEYLNEIMKFYNDLDAKIVTDDNGNLVTDLINLNDIKPDNFLDKTTYNNFVLGFKKCLRNEISFLHKLITDFNDKPKKKINVQQLKKHDIIWKRDKVDLIELVRSLKLSGAINSSTNDLTLKEAYRLFGVFFGIELKNPEDQLRQRANTQDNPYFLEELLKTYKEDMVILKKSREP